MAKATACLLNGRRIEIAEALRLRQAEGMTPPFRCIECGKQVRAHKRGTTGQAAHFEHQERNPSCSLSG